MRILLFIAASLACLAQTEATFMAISSQTGVTSDKLTIQQNQSTPVYAQGVRAVVVSTTAGTFAVTINASGVFTMVAS